MIVLNLDKQEFYNKNTSCYMSFMVAKGKFNVTKTFGTRSFIQTNLAKLNNSFF